MTSERKHQLMQEALDDELSPAEKQEHLATLSADPEYAAQYDSLQQLDDLLRAVPHERAPERLALTIMARLAEALRAQRQIKYPEITDAMMETAVQMVTVAALPLLVGAGWMLLNAQRDPEALEVVLVQVATLFMIVIDVIEIMIEEAEAAFEEDPEAAMALLAYIPIALLTLVGQVLGIEDENGRE